MTNMTVNRPGQADGAGDAKALFITKFAGEVLTAFDETNVMKGLHTERTITEGKSASFPATWKTSAGYHTPGNQILGAQSIKHNERLIHIDDLLISDVFIANIDEAMNHYDVRSIYSKQIGAALARAYDQRTMQVGVLAARASATVSGGNGGSAITAANAKTDGSVLAAAIFDAAVAFDEKDVPDYDRSAIVKPAQYALMAQTTSLINKDWGGAGVYADGSILRVGGIGLVKSNNVPSTVVAAVTGENNTYDGDFSTTAALVLQKSAIGTVKLMDLAVQMTGEDVAVMYQGTLVVGKYAMGHGILRPECAVEIKTA